MLANPLLSQILHANNFNELKISFLLKSMFDIVDNITYFNFIVLYFFAKLN